MKDGTQRGKIYEPELIEISEAIKKLTEHHDFKDTCGIMHALCEVVAQVTRENNMDFEDYVRCALCAWDCSADTRKAKESVKVEARKTWN
jgi:hypothetical protein